MCRGAIVDNWIAVASQGGIKLTGIVGQYSFACHIPRESGEGRLIILNFKGRPMVTVEVKDLGEVNEGWR
jgi:hypothetical protein